jgi:hypothetical protein
MTLDLSDEERLALVCLLTRTIQEGSLAAVASYPHPEAIPRPKLDPPVVAASQFR